MVTPGTAEQDGHASAMNGEAATAYRPDTARKNYLGIDKPNVQFASKDVSRRMASPRVRTRGRDFGDEVGMRVESGLERGHRCGGASRAWAIAA